MGSETHFQEKEFKMKKITIPLLILLALLLSACNINVVRGTGLAQEETRNVSGFDRIVLSIPARMVLTQGESESLEISAEENLLPYIETKVENGTLTIQTKPEMTNLRPTQEIVITLNVIDVNAVTINGAAKVQSEALKADSLSLTINGSGNIDIGQIETQKFKATISGSGGMDFGNVMAESTSLNINGNGKYTLFGESVRAQMTINGSGTIEAKDLACEDVLVSISGAGKVNTWAENQLSVTITGSGTVIYQGEARVKQSITGAGSVRRE
jgi:hypothetical protein